MNRLRHYSILFKLLGLPSQLFINSVRFTDSEIKEALCSLKSLNNKSWSDTLCRVKSLYQQLEDYEVLYPTHKEFPKSFYRLKQPPVFLTAVGNLQLLRHQMVTVVGSRRPLVPFVDWMNDHYVRFLKENDIVTVSGGAYGIDHLATQTALFCGRSSLVILPSGFHESYPRHTKKWLSDKSVLSLSEYFPKETVRKHHFMTRNRLLGIISPHLLMVQCSVKSGTMTTVNAALDSGVEVLVVPSFPNIIESHGNIQLLKDGAQVIATAEDLSLALGLFAPNPQCKNKENEIRNP